MNTILHHTIFSLTFFLLEEKQYIEKKEKMKKQRGNFEDKIYSYIKKAKEKISSVCSDRNRKKVFFFMTWENSIIFFSFEILSYHLVFLNPILK